MVKAYLLQGDVEAAIQNYTTAALSELHQTELTLDACERDLLCVVLANPSHLTSVRRVFEDLVQLQQETLAPLHPRRSFTKLRLAQILIQQGDDLERAEVLLNEALDALQSQSLVPPAVTEEITNLLATVEEMQSEPAPQQSAA
jgi:hypothetical protein